MSASEEIFVDSTFLLCVYLSSRANCHFSHTPLNKMPCPGFTSLDTKDFFPQDHPLLLYLPRGCCREMPPGRRVNMTMEPTFLRGVSCRGTEPHIAACRNWGWDMWQRGPCSQHTHDAAVQCFNEGARAAHNPEGHAWDYDTTWKFSANKRKSELQWVHIKMMS